MHSCFYLIPRSIILIRLSRDSSLGDSEMNTKLLWGWGGEMISVIEIKPRSV